MGLWKTDRRRDQARRSRWCASPTTGGVLSGTIEKLLDPRQAGRQVRQVHRRAQGPAGAGHDHRRGRARQERRRGLLGRRRASSTRTTARSTRCGSTPKDGGKTLEVRGYIGAFCCSVATQTLDQRVE
ncbi:MAG: hypothetical protein MZW92_62780 [Comamonadaceae bacterium]|nr:hypothetical protein [Comamonadaceae bacterium]